MFETDEPAPDLQRPRWTTPAASAQLDRLAEVRRTRNTPGRRSRRWPSCARPREGDANLMPLLVDCVEAYCTVGEITKALKDVWGEYQQPAVF